MRTAAGGVSVFAPVPGWASSFGSVLPSCPVGPIPRARRLLLVVWGAVRGASGSGPVPGAGPGPGFSLALAPVPVRSWGSWQKEAVEGEPPTTASGGSIVGGEVNRDRAAAVTPPRQSRLRECSSACRSVGYLRLIR